MTLLRRIRHLLRRSRHDADLREEMETHRQLRQARIERDGVEPTEADAGSRRALGNAALARDERPGFGGPAVIEAERAILFVELARGGPSGRARRPEGGTPEPVTSGPTPLHLRPKPDAV